MSNAVDKNISRERLGFSNSGDIPALLDFSKVLWDLCESRNVIGMKEFEFVGCGMGFGQRDLNVKYQNRIFNISMSIEDDLDREVIPSRVRRAVIEELEAEQS